MRINWSPTPVEEVLQNVKTLIATDVGTVPFARDLGTPQNVVDLPTPIAGARLQASVIRAVRTYEPRVDISALRLSSTEEGKLDVDVEVGPP